MTAGTRKVTPKVTLDPIVQRVQGNSRKFPEDVIQLVGFVGISPGAANRFRIYPTLQFDQFIEFDESSVAHSEKLTGPDYPLGGTIVWLHGDARVQITRLTNAQATGFASVGQQSQFLQGPIMSGFGSMGLPVWPGWLGAGGPAQPGSGGGCSGLVQVCGMPPPGPGSGGGCSGLVQTCG